MITGKSLSRRSLLRGLGVSMALPILDAMIPAFAATSKTAAKAPVRMMFTYVPNGVIMKDWTPVAEGANFELPRVLAPMTPYRDKMLVLSNLQQFNGAANGDGAGDHARAAATYLTGVHAKKTQGADIEIGISADQVAAQRVGKATRFASLELTCEDGRMVGGCDSGYSCAYSNSISWRSATTPNPPEVNPRAVFERLFGPGDEDPATRAMFRKYNTSILDAVMEDTRSLQRNLGPSDRRKLDEYQSAVREMELRLIKAEHDNKELVPTIDKPDAAPAELTDYAKIMYELLRVAFQTDSTRIATFMVAREGSGRTYREIDVPESHHPLTHHKNNPEMIEKVAKINRYHVELFAEFIGKMAATPDGDGTLLDHTMIMYGSGLSDGNRHEHNHLPVMLVGGGGGTIRTGRHIRLTENTPLNNLYVSMLDRMNVPVEKLGDSTGKIEQLSDLG